VVSIPIPAVFSHATCQQRELLASGLEYVRSNQQEMKACEGPVGHVKVRVRSGCIVLTAKAYVEGDDTF
jgi:hypothetical protein